jgi:alkylphosphonate utilization operon protein PhnA
LTDVKDSNGTKLADGDSVTLIKDLKVKGTSVVLKRGTLIFVSHDREFVTGLATRIIELKPGGDVVDFKGSYDEYLHGQGIDA